MENPVPPADMNDRLQRLQAMITRQWRAFNASFIGKMAVVLLEKPGRLPGQLVGKTPYLQTVQVMARPELIGSVVDVTITGTGTNTLFGDGAEQTAYAPAKGASLAAAGA